VRCKLNKENKFGNDRLNFLNGLVGFNKPIIIIIIIIIIIRRTITLTLTTTTTTTTTTTAAAAAAAKHSQRTFLRF
jgi:hypothetical protein